MPKPAKPAVSFAVICHPEDVPVRGHFDSGDKDQDKELEDEIIARLDKGDDWAWCCVEVRATVDSPDGIFTGSDYLGACSYKNEKDFCTEDGYFPDMKKAALDALKEDLRHETKRGKTAASLLKRLGN